MTPIKLPGYKHEAITREQFAEYRRIQKEGLFNMFDPRARELSINPVLSLDQWLSIITYYEKLIIKYEPNK